MRRGSQPQDFAALERARRRVRALRGFYKHLVIYAFVNAALITVNVLGLSSRPWSAFPLVGWGVGLAVHGFMIWGGSSMWLGREWEERKIAELMSRERIRTLSTEKQLAQAQLRMLQAQIEPHFLFNTLANVVSLIETAPPRASAMLEHFIAYLRATLAASRSEHGTVGQEVDLLRNYLELLKMRMGARLGYTLDIDDGLRHVPLAPMLLQPLVENAVKHGLEPRVQGGHVTVTVRRASPALLNKATKAVTVVKASDDATMVARVEDNGQGFRPGADAGVGLQNLRERLVVLYDGRATVEVEELAQGTAVVLTLPIHDADAPAIHITPP